MSHIQIRNVPPGLHRKLKERAEKAGMSLSEYLLAEVTTIAETPTLEEMVERLRRLPPVTTSVSAAEIIREEREARDLELERRIRGS